MTSTVSSKTSETACSSCGHSPLEVIWNAGPLPIANRFYPDSTTERLTHIFTLALCDKCALLQLLAPALPSDLRRQAAWIQYNEPEPHLDAWVQRTTAAFPDACHGPIFGASPVDATTIARFQKIGLNARTLDFAYDFGIADPLAGTETLQAAISAKSAEKIREQRGPCSVLLARYLLEHMHELPQFFAFASTLLDRDGLLLIEVPDCEAAIQRGDAAILWDQHTFYFTRSTLERCLNANGFSTEGPGLGVEKHGDLLLATARQSGGKTATSASAQEVAAMRDFPVRARQRTTRLREWLQTRSEAPLLLGAGHLADAFCAFVCPGEILAAILDDHPEKVGKCLGNYPRPILPTSEIEARQSRLLLHSLSDASAARVRQKLGNFFARGGEFYSILEGKGDTIPL